MGARPGSEPGTSRTLSENHTPRPTSQQDSHIEEIHLCSYNVDLYKLRLNPEHLGCLWSYKCLLLKVVLARNRTCDVYGLQTLIRNHFVSQESNMKHLGSLRSYNI